MLLVRLGCESVDRERERESEICTCVVFLNVVPER